MCAPAACGRSSNDSNESRYRQGWASGDQGATPSPSASVISLGASLGSCDDVAVCERECDAGSADRCRRLAVSYALGQGVGKDEARATALYEHACAMGDPSGCVFAGQMNEYAHGVPKNDAKAAAFYGRACDLGWAPGCYNFAIVNERGTGVAVDRAKAAELYQKACDAGAPQACDKARELKGPLLDGAHNGAAGEGPLRAPDGRAATSGDGR